MKLGVDQRQELIDGAFISPAGIEEQCGYIFHDDGSSLIPVRTSR